VGSLVFLFSVVKPLRRAQAAQEPQAGFGR
jgi:hypothetical protein